MAKATTGKQVQYWGTGRRKTAVARVWLTPAQGESKAKINGRTMEDYLGGRTMLAAEIFVPLKATSNDGRYDVNVNVAGGGINGQVGAIRLGVARALLKLDPEYRSVLREEDLLTRDPRAKERKKYGRKRARKRFQFSKR
ncbi:MAG: 30S ribosomal protein S9 [Candidatus Sericytochromatia bacterium]|jgi:small subunit ribosomal protein S9|uniref:Small ribosomal subunit protein uS9 n=1 Tax=Candidatus Tanganyikabacteria bacterium TaxID=2961651 RepID=A0A937X558_9BACT|nr:30S ribosomal protein S9 [Candidatus Tanganyikabacteria bacterium]